MSWIPSSLHRLLGAYLRIHRRGTAALLAIAVAQIVLQMLIVHQTKEILDVGIPDSDTGMIASVGIRMIIATVAYCACMVIASRIASDITASVVHDLRRDIFVRAVSMSEEDLSRFGGSGIATRITADTLRIQNLLLSVLRDALIIPVLIMTLTIVSAFFTPMLSALVLAFSAVSILFMRHVGRSTLDRYREAQQRLEGLNTTVRGRLERGSEIRHLGTIGKENELFEIESMRYRDCTYGIGRRLSWIVPIGLLIVDIGVVASYGLGAWGVDAGIADISDIVVFFQLAAYTASCFSVLPSLFKATPKTEIAAERILDLLEASRCTIRGAP